MKKQIAIPTIALFVICLVATALLALANNVTAPIIDELAKKTEIESRQKVLSSATDFKDGKQGDIVYATGYDKDGKPVGLIFTTTEKSYGGDVQVMTGIDTDGKVTGVEILSINDTAGLGQKATEESFRSQFVGLIKDIVVQKNSSNHDNNEITALTGATITSKAVTGAVNDALAQYETVMAKGGAY
ncbi:MAG: FMN-binding protein [Ruminococcus sp.]|nr:FMN-binding protein [Candidatus Copronaster equi]